MPKPHLSRKVVLIVGAALVMCGGTGAAAVFIGADTLLGPSYAELNGFACTELQAVEIQKKDRFWIRKYVTIEEPSDGLGRVKTALRVAKAVQAAKKADLVQVVVLDLNGPTSRAQMRGRSVGADVIYVPDPKRVPEEASARMLTARYIDGTAAANGQFFGERFDMPEDDINALVAKLNDATDCLKPEVEAPAGDGHGAPAAGGHGEKKASGHEAPAAGHGEAPADAHGEAPADGHGDAPAAGHGEETPVAEHGGEAKGWMASVMGMVGLGGEDAPADGHAAPAEDHAAAPAEGHDAAPADGHAAAPAEGHGAAPAGDHAAAPVEGHGEAPAEDHAAAPAEGHDAAPAEDHAAAPAEGHDAVPAEDHAAAPAEDRAAAPAEGHDAAPVEEHAAAPADAAVPAEEGGWFDGLKSMVGLGGETAAEPGQDQAAVPESADAPAGEPIQGDDWLAKMRAAPIKPDAGASAAPADTGHSKNEATTGADAKAGAQHKADAGAAGHEASGHDTGGHGAGGGAPEVPAEDEAILPPKAQPKTDEHAKADH